jgi:hypothetical protein
MSNARRAVAGAGGSKGVGGEGLMSQRVSKGVGGGGCWGVEGQGPNRADLRCGCGNWPLKRPKIDAPTALGCFGLGFSV